MKSMIFIIKRGIHNKINIKSLEKFDVLNSKILARIKGWT